MFVNVHVCMYLALMLQKEIEKKKLLLINCNFNYY